jgi:D-arabinose 1-dehydrogenase-like Zn-dependent alcohol dehydrogenase
MRALRLHGVGDLRLEHVAEPGRENGSQVVVSVQAGGVCGSDLHFVDGSARTAHTPITLGHEIAGTVMQSEAEAWPEGTAVVVAAGTHCGECRRCREGRVNLCENAEILGIDRDGGLADLVAVPEDLLVVRPPGLDADAAATAVDAGATAWHAVTRRAAVGPGASVAVIGVGGLGTYGVQIAIRCGGSVVAVDSDGDALERARSLGAEAAVLAEPGKSAAREVKDLTDGGVDVALEFVGRSSTVDAAVKCLRPGGRAVVVGVGTEPLHTIPAVLWSNNEYTLTGSYGSLPGDIEAVLAALGDGSLVPPPMRRVAIDEAAESIMALAGGARTEPGRLIVIP